MIRGAGSKLIPSLRPLTHSFRGRHNSLSSSFASISGGTRKGNPGRGHDDELLSVSPSFFGYSPEVERLFNHLQQTGAPLPAKGFRVLSPSSSTSHTSHAPPTGIVPTPALFTQLFELCDTNKSWETIVAGWDRMKEWRISPSSVHYAWRIAAHIRQRQPVEAKQAQQEMEQQSIKFRDVLSFNRCLAACAAVSDWQGFEEWAREMKMRNIVADKHTYGILLNAYEKQNRWDDVTNVWKEMKSVLSEPDMPIYTSYTVACLKQEKSEEAKKLLKELRDGSVPLTRQFFNRCLTACAEAKNWKAFEEWNQEMKENGIEADEYTDAILLGAYEKQSRWDAVVQTWNQSSLRGRPDLHIYTTYVAAAIKHGKSGEVRRVMKELERKSVSLNPQFFNRCLAACVDLGNWREFEEWRELMKSQSIPPDEFTIGILLNAYEKQNNWVAISEIWQQMRNVGITPNPVHCTSYLIACLKQGDWRKFDAIMHKMKESNISLGIQEWNRCLDTCIDTENWREFDKLYQRMRATGLTPDPVTFSILLNGYEKQNRWRDVTAVWNALKSSKIQLEHPHFASYVIACIKQDETDEIKSALEEMKRLSIVPRTQFFNRCLQTCVDLDNWKEFEEWYQRMKSQKVKPDAYTISALLDGYEKQNRWSDVSETWELMHSHQIRPSMPIFAIYVSACIKQGKSEEMRNVLTKKGFIAPNAQLFNRCLHSCIEIKNWSEFGEWHKLMKQLRIKPNEYTIGILINGYGKSNNWGGVSRAWNEMSRFKIRPNVHIVTVYASAAIQKGLPHLARDLLGSMKTWSIAPNRRFFNACLSACLEAQNWPEYNRWSQDMEDSSVGSDQYTIEYHLESYERQGNWKAVQDTWEMMRARSIQPSGAKYASYISALIREGKSEEAWKLFQEMKKSDIPAPTVFFNRCLVACLRKRDWKQFDEWQRVMKKEGVKPNEQTIGVLIDMNERRSEGDEGEGVNQRYEEHPWRVSYLQQRI